MEVQPPLSVNGKCDDDCDEKKIDLLSVGVKCVVFGFEGHQLKVLLVKSNRKEEKEKWSLLGGFVKKYEGPDDAALRVLSQFAGIQNIYFEQLHSLGGFSFGAGECEISVGYFALVKVSDFDCNVLTEHKACWFSFAEIPTLIFQHWDLVLKAKARLQERVLYYPIVFELLPRKFTLTQLLNLCEAIYEVSFDRGNFTKKILSFRILKKLDEKEKLDSKRGSHYFVFDKSAYKKRERTNLNFDWG